MNSYQKNFEQWTSVRYLTRSFLTDNEIPDTFHSIYGSTKSCDLMKKESSFHLSYMHQCRKIRKERQKFADGLQFIYFNKSIYRKSLERLFQRFNENPDILTLQTYSLGRNTTAWDFLESTAPLLHLMCVTFHSKWMRK